MTSENFVYWINGFLELTELQEGDGVYLSATQIEMIRNHIKLVLNKATLDLNGLAPYQIPYAAPYTSPYIGPTSPTPYEQWPRITYC